MNTVEDRVREALRTRAEDFTASPDAWQRIRARSIAGAGGRRRRSVPRRSWQARFMIPACAAAAVVAIAVAALAVSDAVGRPGHADVSRLAPPASATAGTSRRAAKGVGPSATPSPTPPYSASGPAEQLLLMDPPVSAVIGLKVRPSSAAQANRAEGYFWIGDASPRYWADQISTGAQLCNDTVDARNGESSGFCSPLPKPNAGHPAVVTGSESVGTGQRIIQGAAAQQVTAVAAVLPDGRSFPGAVATGRGFPMKAWTVGYPQASGVRLVFRDESGTEVASLDTAAPLGPPQVRQPSSGGKPVFRYPAGGGIPAGTMTAYLIDGRVGFWSRVDGGYISPAPAIGGPAADGLILPFDFSRQARNVYPRLDEGFGYARADVTTVVLHLPGGELVGTPTFAAWPGSGLRLWTVSLPTEIQYAGQTIKVTAYDAAGHVIGQDTLGLIE